MLVFQFARSFFLIKPSFDQGLNGLETGGFIP